MAGKEEACCPMSEKPVVVDPPLAEEAAAVAAEPSDSESEITNWVEMPMSNLRWVLSMTRDTDPVPTLEDHGIYTQEDLDRKDADMMIRRMIATLQADQDEFFEYQAWVRETYQRNGRVMVPEDFLGPKDEINKALREAWGDGIVIDAASVGRDAEPEA